MRNPAARANANAPANSSGGKRASSPPEPDADHVEIRRASPRVRRLHRALVAEVAREVDDQLETRACGAAARSSRDDGGERGAHVELGMEKRPDRRRDEQLAVDDVLRERVFDELARQARVVVGRLPARGSPPQTSAETRENRESGRDRRGSTGSVGSSAGQSPGPRDGSAAGRRAGRPVRRRSRPRGVPSRWQWRWTFGMASATPYRRIRYAAPPPSCDAIRSRGATLAVVLWVHSRRGVEQSGSSSGS